MSQVLKMSFSCAQVYVFSGTMPALRRPRKILALRRFSAGVTHSRLSAWWSYGLALRWSHSMGFSLPCWSMKVGLGPCHAVQMSVWHVLPPNCRIMGQHEPARLQFLLPLVHSLLLGLKLGSTSLSPFWDKEQKCPSQEQQSLAVPLVCLASAHSRSSVPSMRKIASVSFTPLSGSGLMNGIIKTK